MSYLKIGYNYGINEFRKMYTWIEVVNNIKMVTYLKIYTVNHSIEYLGIPMNKQGFTDIKKVIIEDDVWSESNVIILPGVKVGEGSVVGNGSIVTMNVESYTIVARNTIKIIK